MGMNLICSFVPKHCGECVRMQKTYCNYNIEIFLPRLCRLLCSNRLFYLINIDELIRRNDAIHKKTR